MTTTKQTYQLQEKQCPQCGSTGPFLLDPSDNFTVSDDGQIAVPPGEWSLDLDCDCPSCGFGGYLEDFCERVEVTGEERLAILRDFLKSWGH